jgi:hypothetical protein
LGSVQTERREVARLHDSHAGYSVHVVDAMHRPDDLVDLAKLVDPAKRMRVRSAMA